MPNSTIRLLIVDDHPVLRQSLVNLLTVYCPLIEVIAQAGNAQDALVLAQENQLDIVLTDVQMSPQSGIHLIKTLRLSQPTTRYVVFTALTDTESLLQAFDAGAEGFLTKDSEAHELVGAIESVMAGATHYPARLKAALSQRQQQPVITPREREVLAWVARGLTSKEIARKLSIDPRTVDVHRANIRQRFSLDSSAALLRFAIESAGFLKN
jgi:two-component system, NarL family, nitrate/nitrite response regulator NarL